MYINTAAEYQEALMMLEAYQERETSDLTVAERNQFVQLIRAIESFQSRYDPVSVFATFA